MTFTPDVGGELSCGLRKQLERIVLTYQPTANANAKADGTIVSIEFVPKDFEIK